MQADRRLLILYGSQTFTAQEIAEKIWRKTKALGFKGPVTAMDDYPISNLINEEYTIFVCATTGQGDEPDNMKNFWKFLLKKTLPPNSLARMKYGVLGLGDSSYLKFNFVAKKLHKRLLQLGGHPLLNAGLCDYQHDLGHEAVAHPWLNEYIRKLEMYFPDLPMDKQDEFIPRWNVSLIKNAQKQKRESFDVDIYFEKCLTEEDDKILSMEVDSNDRTTDKSHFQDVRLISLCSMGHKLMYNPGDIFNVRPRNLKPDIEELFKIFEDHSIDIKPDYKIALERRYEGPEKAAVIGGFSGGANTANSQDDEYRYAGVEDPKIMITTSREPSARLKMFVKELRLIFPNSQRMNRGGYEMSQLIHACRANEVTDFIVVHEHRGVPDSLVICHLPYGPTASFTLSGVVMRHDIPDIGPMTEQYPHLVFHNFNTDLDMPVPEFLKTPLAVYQIAEQYWDLRCIPSQYVFSLLALHSDDKTERDKCIELSSPEGQEEWLNYCRRPRRTILEVLKDFHKSTSKLAIEVIFELFTNIKPRSFSIASSCKQSHNQKIDLLVAVVKYYTKLKDPRLGLCSNWLRSLRPHDKIFGWIKVGTFNFPEKNVPLILVGPGTGLAPFRNLITERIYLGTANKDNIHLFFGCRYSDRDYHCKDELEGYVKDGHISLYLAFSREQKDKVYVQHRIREHQAHLWRLISEQNASIYIAGNAKDMPDGVKSAFMDVAINSGVNQEAAQKYIEDMEISGRLQVECW